MNILLVTGSRAWDADRRSARWARDRIARWVLGHWHDNVSLGAAMEVVAHGDAPGPDTYADEIADALLIPRVVFPLGGWGTPVLRDREGHDRRRQKGRLLRDAESWRFPSGDPLERNATMVRWAAAQEKAGHSVIVLGLVAPWTLTGGTRHTLRLAATLGLRVEEYPPEDVPAAAWPAEEAGPGWGAG